MTDTTQQILPLSLPDSTNHHDYIISDTNALAYEALMGDTPLTEYATLLTGEQGCGKTILAQFWATSVSATFIPTLSEDYIAHITQKHYVLEDIDTQNETALFHLLNQAKAHGATILLTSRHDAASLPFTLPDLLSRLRALSHLPIAAPDDAMLEALLMQRLAERQLTSDPAVIQYLLPRMQRSFVSLHQLIDHLDRLSLTEKRAITLPLAKKALNTLD